ncbi:DinB family protein [bacterium]|nr:DinB family protein [Bacteroidota bacterium]MDC3064232.1 DinB family protein [bacterium]
MSKVKSLVNSVEISRKSYIQTIGQLSKEITNHKPDESSWNIVEITEHLYWAEFLGIAVMAKVLNEILEGKREIKYESKNKGLKIEKVVELTWNRKEQVPDIAAPRVGGSISFWINSFISLKDILKEFTHNLTDDMLRVIAHAHPISGELDFQQRLEFLRFHIDRHHLQAKRNTKDFKQLN